MCGLVVVIDFGWWCIWLIENLLVFCIRDVVEYICYIFFRLYLGVDEFESNFYFLSIFC